MTPTVDVLKTKQNLTGNAGKNCVRQEYAAIRPGLLRQTIGGLEFLKLQPVAAFLATSAIICEARKLLRPNQSNFNPEFFVFRGVAIHEEIGRVWRTRFQPRRKTVATAALLNPPIGDGV
jgi:hypothetical protein